MVDAVDRRLAELTTLNAIGDRLNRAPDLDRALTDALAILVEALPDARAAWLFVARTEHGDRHFTSFRLDAQAGAPPGLTADGCAELRDGSCECQGMFRRGELDRGLNLVTCSRLESAREGDGDTAGLVVHASVPLRSLGDAPYGILNVAAPGEHARFDDNELELLAAVGSQLGAACHRAQLLAQREAETRHSAVLEERHRVAREVHDSVAQLLFGADLSLRVAREQASDGVRDAVARSADLVETALGELRGLVELLRVGDLDEGLLAALTRLVTRTSGAVTVHLDACEADPQGRVAVALYRVAQEGVHNALRHADPANVWVRLEARDGALVLVVEDDGRGYPEDLAPGLGISSMRDRAADVGGRLRTGRSEQGGALLELEVPWRSAS